MTTEEMYEKFGIKKDVIDFGKTVLGEIEDRFAKIDEVAEINQLKVIHAMQKNRVSENHLWGTTGYGYNDIGRDTLEAVYADIFEAEDALGALTDYLWNACVDNCFIVDSSTGG